MTPPIDSTKRERQADLEGRLRVIPARISKLLAQAQTLHESLTDAQKQAIAAKDMDLLGKLITVHYQHDKTVEALAKIGGK